MHGENIMALLREPPGYARTGAFIHKKPHLGRPG